MTAVIRLLLVDGHPVIRLGYLRILDKVDDIRVIAEAKDGDEALRRCSVHRPDVVVMEVALAGASGIETTRKILAQSSDCAVLIVSMREDAVSSSRALQAGARGYVEMSASPEVLVEAIRRVAAGDTYIGQRVAQKLALHATRRRSSVLSVLSENEFELLRLLATGHSLAEAAEVLNLTTKTVANYQAIIKRKLRVKNIAQLVRLAIAEGVDDQHVLQRTEN